MKPIAAAAAFAAFMIASPAAAQTTSAIVRVVDVGPGLCVVASLPGGQDLLYDGGHWTSSTCLRAVREMVTDRRIELVILSHSDSDHLGELDDILAENAAGTIIHGGDERTTQSYRDARREIDRQGAAGARVINLADETVEPGRSFPLGEGQVTFLAGWHEWDPSLSTHSLRPEELRNVISIVVRLEYRGHSVILAGDSIGRPRDDEDDAICDHAERWMVQRHGTALRSDVLVASHHGGNNGSATCFLEAIRPRFVIFSAGHDHQHPTARAAARAIAAGVPTRRIFRTDYGDDEGGFEWTRWRRPHCRDQAGDDDIEIRLPRSASRRVRVRYLSMVSSCQAH